MKTTAKVFLLIFLLCGVSTPILAQTSYSVKGIVSEESGEGVPYATVSLKQDSISEAFLKRAAAGVNGKFEIEISLEKGFYFIHIEAIGKKVILRKIELAGEKTVNAGEFVMTEANEELSEVRVVATKPLVTMEIDRIGYDVKADPESLTSNVFDMLRKVPMVTVDGEDNIQVKGSSSFKIYINGKLSNIVTKNPKDIFKSMPASSIKKIEVITDPGAKYDAEGVSAVLNIITESALQGFQGSVRASVNTQNSIGAGGYLSSKIGKFGVTANYNHTQYGRTSWSETHTENLGENMPYKFSDTYSINDNKGHYHWGSLEASYEFDTLNLLSASFGVYGGMFKTFANEPSRTYMRNRNGDTISAYSSFGNNRNSYLNYSGNLDYQRTLKKEGQLLTVSYLFDLSPDNDENISIIEKNKAYTSTLNVREMNMKYISRGKSDEHTFQIDYTEPFDSSKHIIEMGLKYILRYNASDNDYKLYNKLTGKYDLDTNRMDNDMHYYQHIAGAYASYTFKWKKISVRAGVRLEGTYQDVQFPDMPVNNFTAKFIDIIPSISFSYKPGDRSNFRLGYNNGISRPSIWYLNPYVDDSNPYYVSYGNSKLKSERSHGFSLSYGYVAPKFNMNISVYASFVNNSIESARTLQEYNGIEGVIVSTYENVGKYSNVGGNFYIDYNPFKWVRFSAQGRSGYAHYKNNDYSYGTYSWNVFSSLNFTLPWKVKLNIGGGGSSPWVGYKYRGTSWYYYYGSLMRSFLKGDKLTVSLDARDLFEKYRSYTSKSWEENIFSRESISKQPSRTFGISVSWRFGEMEAEIKKAERGISNSDVKSGGGSSGGGN